MLELTPDQLHQLTLLEARGHVDQVHDAILADHPAQNNPPLRPRLYQAYDHAIALGFRHSQPLTQFLYFEAMAPGFYPQPPIDAWLRKPGAPVEQRFADLIAVLNAKLPKGKE